MSKQVLDIQQMLHLKELSVDTDKASMAYIINITDKYNPFLCLNSDAIDHVDFYNYALGAFTLQDILDLLPSEIKENSECNILSIDKFSDDWYVRYGLSDEFDPLISFEFKELIDAAYEMLCWCIENGHLETKEEG